MKRTDIAMIILIASMSMLAAYFLGRSVLGSSKETAVTVKTAEPIQTEVAAPDKRVFNENAINPMVTVVIGPANGAGR